MPPLPPSTITASRQLLVEGRSAELFFQALMPAIGLTGFQLQNFGGIADLPRFLRLLRNDPGFGPGVTALAIVRDAEASALTAQASICTALRGAGLPEPAQLMVPAVGPPSVSVFLFPDSSSPGMLEDLCLQAISADPAVQCVDAYFDCLQQQGITTPSPLAKARLQAFLASRPRPGLLLGQAAGAGYFPWQHPALDLLKQFLHGL
jgi:hypothetical protein